MDQGQNQNQDRNYTANNEVVAIVPVTASGGKEVNFEIGIEIEPKVFRVYQIWQVRETAPNFNKAQPAYWTNARIRAEVYRKVGEVRTHRLEEAYYMTQNLDYGWGGFNDPYHAEGHVSKFVTGVCRSTGVGDVIVVSEPGRTFSNPAYMVNDMGFIDVSEPRIKADY